MEKTSPQDVSTRLGVEGNFDYGLTSRIKSIPPEPRSVWGPESGAAGRRQEGERKWGTKEADQARPGDSDLGQRQRCKTTEGPPDQALEESTYTNPKDKSPPTERTNQKSPLTSTRSTGR